MTEIVADGNFIYVTFLVFFFFDKNIIKIICWFDDCCFSWIYCDFVIFESIREHI